MSKIIEHGGNDPEVVRISSGEGSEISLKTYQDIYHQITGKTEEIRKRYKDSICIEYSDIEQLHIKITQLYDVFDVVASNESVILYYEKERKEQFTSFEKFRAFNSSCTSPVSNIVLKYELSIIPAKLKKPQEYSITIRLSSRVTQLRELKADAPPFMHGPLIIMIASETAEIRVEYSDYVISRSFIEAFDEWIKGCKKSNENNFVKWLQRYSHFIPPVGKVVVTLLYGYFIYAAIDPVLGSEPSLVLFARFIVFSSVTIVIAINLTHLALRMTERAIDSYSFVSWIKLNRGDEQVINESSISRIRNIVLLFVSAAGAIAIGVISSQISGLIDSVT